MSHVPGGFDVPIVRDDIPDCRLPEPPYDPREWFREYVRRQIEWSHRTFGPGKRTLGLLAHIVKECQEIERCPFDLEEWIDLIILALDGAWRCGQYHDCTPEDIMNMLDAKQLKNFNRNWPKPVSEDLPVEHLREAHEEERESNP